MLVCVLRNGKHGKHPLPQSPGSPSSSLGRISFYVRQMVKVMQCPVRSLCLQMSKAAKHTPKLSKIFCSMHQTQHNHNKSRHHISNNISDLGQTFKVHLSTSLLLLRSTGQPQDHRPLLPAPSSRLSTLCTMAIVIFRLCLRLHAVTLRPGPRPSVKTHL